MYTRASIDLHDFVCMEYKYASEANIRSLEVQHETEGQTGSITVSNVSERCVVVEKRKEVCERTIGQQRQNSVFSENEHII